MVKKVSRREEDRQHSEINRLSPQMTTNLEFLLTAAGSEGQIVLFAWLVRETVGLHCLGMRFRRALTSFLAHIWACVTSVACFRTGRV